MVNYRRLLSLFAGMAAALSSCVAHGDDSEPGTEPIVDPVALTVTLSGVGSSATRALEDQASDAASAIVLGNGHIYIINPATGSVTYNTPLDVSQATGDGQTLPQLVASDSRVFILGNIPSGINAGSLGSLTAIRSAAAAVSTQTDYTRAVLANDDFLAESIVTTITGRATVAVTIRPVISRLELLQLRGNTDIKGFTVTGVFLDSYYPSFTFGGSHAGSIFEQGQRTTFSGTGDTDTFAAALTSGRYIAKPTAGKVWAYNVAAGAKPRLIARMTNIKYVKQGETTETDLGTAVRYLTLKGYNGMSNFKPGEVYRITTLDFGYNHLASTPNGSDVDLGVSIINVIDWDVVNPGVVVEKP